MNDLKNALAALDEPAPADLLAQLRLQLPAPQPLSRPECWAWLLAPLLTGALLLAWLRWGWHIQPEGPALALPLLAAAALHALAPRLFRKDTR